MELKEQEIRLINRIYFAKAENGANLQVRSLDVNVYKPQPTGKTHREQILKYFFEKA